MNITKKIIITDTNIIDMVKNDEINSKTGNVNIINNFKTVGRTSEQIKEMFIIPQKEKSLSQYDVMNYIIVRDNNAILATGD